MIYTGTDPKDRLLYTYEERKKLLQENYGICACCGKKLDTKTMRIEHIIPLSRGGKNEDANKTVLCEPCNDEKDNLFYLPSGFYLAIKDTPRFRQISQYTRDWYQSLKPEDRLDLRWFPLITPKNAVSIERAALPSSVRHKKKKPGINIQTILEWHLVGNENRAEVEAVTNMYIREARSLAEHNPYWMETQSAVYILKKKSTDKLLCLAGIYYNPDEHFFRIYPVWSTLNKHMLPQVVIVLAAMALDAIRDIAQEEITHYEIQSSLPHALDAFKPGGMLPIGMGESGRYMHYKDGFDDPCIEVSMFNVEDFKPSNV